MKKLKHNKLRNTGLIFEILSRISMHEVLNGQPNNAIRIIKKHFVPDSPLFTEMRLYEALSKQDKESFAEELIELSLKGRNKIPLVKLNEEKYNLVKSIKSKYKLEEFFGTRVSNYKLLASIYKIFEGNGEDSPEEFINAKTLVLEHISGKKEEKTTSEADEIIAEANDPDVVKLGFKIIVEKFNEKYRNLNPKQRKLLSSFINEDTNTEKFKNFVFKEVGNIARELTDLGKKLDDPITRIKLDEAINLTQEIARSPIIKDEHLSAMLKYYELIEVLNEN